eukprot:5188739-Prymnesium_polylepis.1
MPTVEDLMDKVLVKAKVRSEDEDDEMLEPLAYVSRFNGGGADGQGHGRRTSTVNVRRSTFGAGRRSTCSLRRHQAQQANTSSRRFDALWGTSAKRIEALMGRSAPGSPCTKKMDAMTGRRSPEDVLTSMESLGKKPKSRGKLITAPNLQTQVRAKPCWP